MTLPPGVVVSGLGVVCAAGIGLQPLLAALADGRPRRAALPFPAAGFPRQEGAVAPARAELANLLLRRKDLKLMTPDTLLAVAAGVLAWRDAGFEEQPPDAEQVGLFLGVGAEKGEVTDLAPGVTVALRDGRLDPTLLARDGLDRINPLDSLKTLPNMALAHLAIRLGLRGPALALCGSPAAGLLAVEEAAASVAAGECRAALAGATDCLVSLAGFAQAWRAGALDDGAFPGEAAVVLVLELEQSVRARRWPAWAEPATPPTDDGPDLAALESAVGRCGVAGPLLVRAVAHGRAGRMVR